MRLPRSCVGLILALALSTGCSVPGQGWSLVDDPSGNQWLLFQQRAPQDVFVSFALPVGPGELVLRVF